MAIKITISLPEHVLAKAEADKVVMPIASGTVTIIHERAPSVQLLTAGVVQLLDINNRVGKRWFISGGMVDIANDECVLAVEKAVSLDTISLDEAREKAENSKFYQQIYEYLKAFG